MITLKHHFIRRLKTASMREVIYRLERLLLDSFMKRLSASGRLFLNAPEVALADIQKINLPNIVRSSLPIRNHMDEEARIRIDSLNPPIDIRLAWEPGRLQDITRTIFSTENISESVQQDIKKSVLDWIQNNPFLLGVHYMSPMECALRTPVFFYVFTLSRIDWKQDEIRTMLSSIYRHTWWVSKNLALYSSLGNHTISECIGLIFGGAVFQNTHEGKKWINEGYRLLDQEIHHQIHDDGGPVEQSLSYHRFVLDLFWLAVSFLESNDFKNCSAWKERLFNGEKFLNAFTHNGRQTPFIGDSDDGYAVAPGLHPERQIDVSVDMSSPISGLSYATFPDSGYTVIQNRNGLFLTFDHGPLGMPPLYNHGHADALSITLYKNKQPFLIDPGTYRYNGVPEYRAYFKGTRAHNTVCIDTMDQADQLTGFIWDKPYQTVLESIRKKHSCLYLKATHNGYARLKKPVYHARELYVSQDHFLLIVDSFFGKDVHRFELNFHLDPGVIPDFQEGWITQKNGKEEIFLYDPDNSFNAIHGQRDPLLGWYSPCYGILQKTTTLQQKKPGKTEEIRFMSLICFENNKKEQAIRFLSEIVA